MYFLYIFYFKAHLLYMQSDTLYDKYTYYCVKWVTHQITHASKVMIRILTKRIRGKTEAIGGLGDDQFGFRKGMGTRDAIGTLRVLTERSIQNGQDVYICFVDYEKAFD